MSKHGDDPRFYQPAPAAQRACESPSHVPPRPVPQKSDSPLGLHGQRHSACETPAMPMAASVQAPQKGDSPLGIHSRRHTHCETPSMPKQQLVPPQEIPPWRQGPDHTFTETPTAGDSAQLRLRMARMLPRRSPTYRDFLVTLKYPGPKKTP